MKKAVKSAPASKNIELRFQRTGIPWIDAGTAGLFRVLTGKTSYLIDSLLKGRLQAAKADVSVEFSDEGDLCLIGSKDQLQQLLELAYEDLMASYFNVASENQRRENANYRLDSATQTWVRYSKKKAAGAALLLKDGKNMVRGGAAFQHKWKTDQSGKAVVALLPDDFTHLQSELDTFLEKEKINRGLDSGFLVDSELEVRVVCDVKVGALPKNEICLLTGQIAEAPTKAMSTAFPLFGGSRSFTNDVTGKSRIGWQMAYVGTFAPAVAFFYVQNDDMYLFFPQSSVLSRIVDVSEELVGMRQVQANFFKNFELQLGGYFSERSEILFAFLHAVFRHFSGYRPPEPVALPDDDADDELVSLGPVDDAEVNEVEHISCQQVFDKLCRGAPVNFAVVAARKMGNLWMGRDFQTFTDVLYIARLLDLMTRVVPIENGPQRQRCSPKRLMSTLIDFDSKKNKTLLRNKVCERILTKQSVLSLLERHAYHKFSQWKPGEPLMISVLRDFALLYEPEICEVHGMNKPEFEQMAQSAKWLGEKIADAVAGFTDGESNERVESVGRSKGVFFRLRRARMLQDFQEEIIRIQMRYKLDIPAHALDADRFNPETFAQFKGFCVIAALSRFEYRQSQKRQCPQQPSNFYDDSNLLFQIKRTLLCPI
jgi:hypothetical protein